MNRIVKRFSAGLLFLAAFGVAPPAHAQFTSDAALLAQLLVQEQQAVSNLEQILTALQNQTKLVETILTGEGVNELGLALGLLQTAETAYSAILASTRTIGFSIQAIHPAFAATFPNTSGYVAMPSSSFPVVESGWQDEILASSEIAARSQSEVADTQATTELATEIIRYSGSAPGEVAQLQLIVQMLGVVQTDMTMLVQNLTTTGRALTEGSAAGASERQLSTERKRRNRLNYTDRGPTVFVPNVMP